MPASRRLERGRPWEVPPQPRRAGRIKDVLLRAYYPTWNSDIRKPAGGGNGVVRVQNKEDTPRRANLDQFSLRFCDEPLIH